MSTRLHRKFCGVFGCLNTSSDPALSLFEIPSPSQRERRLKWLQLIGREDLINRSTCNYVCQAHFKEEDIRINKLRKSLKKTALPCFHLPNHGALKEDKETQTEIATVNSSSQTDMNDILENVAEMDLVMESAATSTQTEKSYLQINPRKRKQKSESLEFKKRLKEHATDKYLKSKLN